MADPNAQVNIDVVIQTLVREVGEKAGRIAVLEGTVAVLQDQIQKLVNRDQTTSEV